MFERYTEKARRVILFAYIDTEYILLGLLREDRALIHHFAGRIVSGTDIRTEVERAIRRGAPIPTSVEVLGIAALPGKDAEPLLVGCAGKVSGILSSTANRQRPGKSNAKD
jgi:L-asparaginase II